MYTRAYFVERERSPTFALELYAVRTALAERGVLRGRILEVGAGSGALARACGRDASMWVASDRDLRHFDCDRVSGSRTYRLVCDASQPPLVAKSCDGIVAQHVIEHFAEPAEVLTKWASLLRPGGVCALVSPNRLFPYLDWFDDPTHHVLFSAAELASLMEEVGFTRISVMRLVPWLGSQRTVYLAARLQRWLPGALGLARDPSLSLLAVGSLRAA